MIKYKNIFKRRFPKKLMDMGQISREKKLSRKRFLEDVVILGSSFFLGGCGKTIIVQPEDKDTNDNSNGSSPKYNSLTGVWDLSTGILNSDKFTASLDAMLYITQTNQLLEGYSKDVYKITGTFSDFNWFIQRKSDNLLYPIQNASGNIVEGGININLGSHNLKFSLASSAFLTLRGVAIGYESMDGDITLNVDMTNMYHSPEGITTFTGKWDAKRE